MVASRVDDAHAWSDALELGIPSFDAEHRAFMGLIGRFVAMIERGEARMVIEATFDKVVDIFHFHSTDEENLLDGHGYHGLDRHAIEHQRIRTLLNSLRMEFMAGDFSPAHTGFARLIARTIAEHIQTHDQGYAAFLREKGVA